MLDLATSLLARLSALLAPLERRPDFIAIPIRRDHWQGPRRDGRRY